MSKINLSKEEADYLIFKCFYSYPTYHYISVETFKNVYFSVNKESKASYQDIYDYLNSIKRWYLDTENTHLTLAMYQARGVTHFLHIIGYIYYLIVLQFKYKKLFLKEKMANELFI